MCQCGGFEDDSGDWSIKLTDIPVGQWDLHGNWFPNHNLEMSVSDQIKHNTEGGHYRDVVCLDDLRGVLVSDEPLTFLERLRRWWDE